jgi:hypothetical protein
LLLLSLSRSILAAPFSFSLDSCCSFLFLARFLLLPSLSRSILAAPFSFSLDSCCSLPFLTLSASQHLQISRTADVTSADDQRAREAALQALEYDVSFDERPLGIELSSRKLVVTTLHPGGQGGEKGVELGSRVVKVEGAPVADLSSLAKAVASTGRPMVLTFRRKRAAAERRKSQEQAQGAQEQQRFGAMKEFNRFLYGENGKQNAAAMMMQEQMKDSAKSSVD